MGFHDAATGVDMHGPYNAVFADATARLADAGPYTASQSVAGGSLNPIRALQKDTNVEYILSNHSPITWATIGGGGPPAAHAASHQHGGSDEVATATPAANVIPKAGASGTLADGFIPTLNWTKLLGVGIEILEPSGFISRTTSTISRVDGTRTFTIAPVSGSFDVWVAGTKYSKSSAQDVVWPDVEGMHFFYFDTSGVLQTTASSSVLESVIAGYGALVSAVYWEADNNVSNFMAEERHGLMPGAVHLPWHLAFSAQWVSGGQLGNFVIGDGSLATHAQWSVSDFRMLDEDIILDIADGSPQELAPTLTAPVFYRSGANGYWRKKTADTYPFIQSGAAGYTGANGRCAYNRWTGATWQLTEVSQGDYVTAFVYGTNDPAQPVVIILGQRQYATLPALQAGILSELAALTGLEGLFSKELVPLGAVALQTSTAFGNSVRTRVVVINAAGDDYLDLRGYRRGEQVIGASDLPAHASTHNAGGSDAMAIDAAAGTGSLRTLGTSATSACSGSDSRLSDARTPTAHASSHISTGGDAIAAAVSGGASGLMTGADKAKLDKILGSEYQINGGTAVTGNFSVDFSTNALKQMVVLGASVSITSLTFPGAGNYVLRIIQDATGNRVLTWPAAVQAPGGKAVGLILSTTASAVDIAAIYYDGSVARVVLSKAFAA